MSLLTNPAPLGKIVPGLAASVLAVTNVAAQIGANPMVDDIVIQQPSGSPGHIYICSDANPPDLADFTNVLRELSPGAWYSASSGNGKVNGVDSRAYYIGADDAGAYAIGEVREG
jgi:hypothetical protein